MKHLFTLFLFFGFGIQNISAQNFQMLKSNSEYIYHTPSEISRSLRIDSVSFDGDSLFFMNNHIRYDIGSSFDCASINAASMVGYYVRIKPNGTHQFINLLQDTITINVQNNVNDSWICWTHQTNGTRLRANVESEIIENFLGISDNVKTINFQMLDSDSNPIDHLSNGLSLKISENYGMIKAINFVAFPHLTQGYFSGYFDSGPMNLDLWGMSNPELGIQNLTFREIINYSIDDEIHFVEYKKDQGVGWEVHYQDKVVSEFIFPDSTVYEIERKKTRYAVSMQVYTFEWEEEEQIFITSKDNPIIDPLPDEPIHDYLQTTFTEDGIYYLNNLALNNGRREKRPVTNHIGFYKNENNPECYEQIIDYFCFSGVNERYIEGVGGPFFDCSAGFSNSGIQLRYYNKEDEIWGEPLNLNPVNLFASQTVKLFPNPVVESFTLETELVNLPAIIEVRDLQGRLVISEIIQNEKSQFRFENRSKGMFIYTIHNQKGLLQTGKFIRG